MKKLLIFSFFILCNITLIMLYGKSISLEDITAGFYRPQSISQGISSQDGQSFFRPADDNTKIVKYSYKTGLAIDTVLDLKEAKGIPINSFDGFSFSPDENKILLFTDTHQIYRRSFNAFYYCYDIASKTIHNITDVNKKIKNPIFSPDSKKIAYISDNNIWLYNLDNYKETQVTLDGSLNRIINGSTDWVYEEEFATTSIMSFSPNSNFLAFVRFDESQVKEFSFPIFKDQLYPNIDIFKYPKAGEANSSVSCKIYNIKTQQSQKVILPSNTIEYIPRIEFVSDSSLMVMTLNREQNDFRMYAYNPYRENNHCELILDEKNDTYVDYDFIESLKFIPEGFFFISERDGYSHIYLYNLNGSINRQLTNGKFDITQILAYDQNNKILFYQAADATPLGRNIFRYDLRNNKSMKLSKQEGYNFASFSNNGQFFINNWSDIHTPNIITLNSTNSGDVIHILENNHDLEIKLSKIDRNSKEFIIVKAADGTDLNAYIMKPKDFDSSKKYPLLMVQYSGPNSQQVLNQFSIDWTDYLVDQGYLVVAVDGRGTGARGEGFKKSTYLNLGIHESDDQIAAAKYLATLPYVDEKNISIWGWSFGGYNVLMSLSRSEGIFKNGIAIAPVTDWRFYDSVYTERYMNTPQKNQKGYDMGSPIKLANNLSGNLLLVHGSADDNVHFQNSMEYISSLIENKKQFDLFIFPDLNHSLLGANNRLYLYKKIINFLENN